MASDPCAKERSEFEKAQTEFEKAEKAFDSVNDKWITPLQTEINRTDVEIKRLETEGDPNSLIPNLRADVSRLKVELSKNKQRADFRNASAYLNSAKNVLSLTGSDLSICEEKAKKPKTKKEKARRTGRTLTP